MEQIILEFPDLNFLSSKSYIVQWIEFIESVDCFLLDLHVYGSCYIIIYSVCCFCISSHLLTLKLL